MVALTGEMSAWNPEPARLVVPGAVSAIKVSWLAADHENGEGLVRHSGPGEQTRGHEDYDSESGESTTVPD